MGQLCSRGQIGAALAMASVVALAGCGGDDDPQPAHTYAIPTPGPGATDVTATGTAAPSATPTPGPVPAAARADTEAGAKAFVRFYFERISLAVRYPEQSWLTGLGTQSCNLCTSYEGLQRQLLEDGSHLEGTLFRVFSAEQLPISKPKARAFEVILKEGPVKAVDRHGRVTQRDEPTQVTGHVLVESTGHGWVITDARRLDDH